MRVEMKSIHLSTDDSEHPEIVLDIWDEKVGKMKDLGGFKGLLGTVIDALDSAFDNFAYYGIGGEEELEDDSILA
jgi:hypothetical protein